MAASRGPLTLSDDLDLSGCSVVIIMALYLKIVSDDFRVSLRIVSRLHYLGDKGKRHHDSG